MAKTLDESRTEQKRLSDLSDRYFNSKPDQTALSRLEVHELLCLQRQQLKRLERSITRYLNLDMECDYAEQETSICDHEQWGPANPLECKGIKEEGSWCHWCDLHGALVGIDDSELTGAFAPPAQRQG